MDIIITITGVRAEETDAITTGKETTGLKETKDVLTTGTMIIKRETIMINLRVASMTTREITTAIVITTIEREAISTVDSRSQGSLENRSITNLTTDNSIATTLSSSLRSLIRKRALTSSRSTCSARLAPLRKKKARKQERNSGIRTSLKCIRF